MVVENGPTDQMNGCEKPQFFFPLIGSEGTYYLDGRNDIEDAKHNGALSGPDRVVVDDKARLCAIVTSRTTGIGARLWFDICSYEKS